MAVVISGGQTVSLARPGLNIREALADVQHAIEDGNRWQDLSLDPSNYSVGQDFSQPDRFRMLWRMRTLSRRNPTAKWICRLGANFTFGTGASAKASDQRYVQPVIDEFWSERGNKKTLTSSAAQTERFIDLFRDGDLFLVAFVDEITGLVRWRRLDAMFVADVVTDPNDVLTPRWYKVRSAYADYNFLSGTYDARSMPGEFVFLRDWQYEPRPGDQMPPANMIRPGLVNHLAINKEAKFGLSEFYASEDWINAHRTFMEDRASLLRAWSTLAWKVTRKNDPGGIQAFQKAMQSTYASGNLLSYERNPNAAPAATLVQNEGSSREPVEVNTGGDAAVQDGESLLQMAAVGAGVYTHYLGSTGVHRLATVTSMELPALKNYEWWQRFWGDSYEEMLQFSIDCAIRAGRIPGDAERVLPSGYLVTDTVAVVGADGAPTGERAPISRDVTMEFPPIVMPDMAGVVNATASLANSVLPVNIGSRKRLARIAFGTLGVDDIQQAIDECFPEGEEDDVILPGSGNTTPLQQLLNPPEMTDDADKKDDDGES